MRYKAKLPVYDGRVLCPRIEGWRDFEDCAHCHDLARITTSEATGQAIVECRPVVGHPLRTLERLISA